MKKKIKLISYNFQTSHLLNDFPVEPKNAARDLWHHVVQLANEDSNSFPLRIAQFSTKNCLMQHQLHFQTLPDVPVTAENEEKIQEKVVKVDESHADAEANLKVVDLWFSHDVVELKEAEG
jgi:hypothetical protein